MAGQGIMLRAGAGSAQCSTGAIPRLNALARGRGHDRCYLSSDTGTRFIPLMTFDRARSIGPSSAIWLTLSRST